MYCGRTVLLVLTCNLSRGVRRGVSAEGGSWTVVGEDGRGGGCADALTLAPADGGDDLLVEVHSDALAIASGRVPIADVWAVRAPRSTCHASACLSVYFKCD